MNQEQLRRMMEGQVNQQQGVAQAVTSLDKFIDRCMREKDETLFSLGQSINVHLQRSQILSYLELEVYPQVMQRIQVRLNEGED